MGKGEKHAWLIASATTNVSQIMGQHDQLFSHGKCEQKLLDWAKTNHCGKKFLMVGYRSAQLLYLYTDKHKNVIFNMCVNTDIPYTVQGALKIL